VNRRGFFAIFVAGASFLRAAAQSLRGRLRNEPPSLEVNGQQIALTGDDETKLVLADARLNGLDFEVLGTRTSENAFTIEPIHLRALFVHRNGERLMVTYWCDVCYIRTFSPGLCWCCRKDTDLDLRASLD
jgi:hypothetical protein